MNIIIVKNKNEASSASPEESQTKTLQVQCGQLTSTLQGVSTSMTYKEFLQTMRRTFHVKPKQVAILYKTSSGESFPLTCPADLKAAFAQPGDALELFTVPRQDGRDTRKAQLESQYGTKADVLCAEFGESTPRFRVLKMLHKNDGDVEEVRRRHLQWRERNQHKRSEEQLEEVYGAKADVLSVEFPSTPRFRLLRMLAKSDGDVECVRQRQRNWQAKRQGKSAMLEKEYGIAADALASIYPDIPRGRMLGLLHKHDGNVPATASKIGAWREKKNRSAGLQELESQWGEKADQLSGSFPRAPRPRLLRMLNKHDGDTKVVAAKLAKRRDNNKSQCQRNNNRRQGGKTKTTRADLENLYGAKADTIESMSSIHPRPRGRVLRILQACDGDLDQTIRKLRKGQQQQQAKKDIKNQIQKQGRRHNNGRRHGARGRRANRANQPTHVTIVIKNKK